MSSYTLSDDNLYKIALGEVSQNYIVTGVPAEIVNDPATNNLIGGKKIQGRSMLNQASKAMRDQKLDWIKRMMHGFHLPDH